MQNINLYLHNFQDKVHLEEFLIILIFQCKETQAWCSQLDRDQMYLHKRVLYLVPYKSSKDNQEFLQIYKEYNINKFSHLEECPFIKISNCLQINYNSYKGINLLSDNQLNFPPKQALVQMPLRIKIQT